MAFEIPKIKYTGSIREVALGTGPKAVRIGGASCYPFHRFEGDMPNTPRVAFEVWDGPPDEWQEWAIEPYRDVLSDPVAWARKCIDTYGAEMIVLQLRSADPNGENKGTEEVVEVVKRVADAIDVPLLAWGTANDDKDGELLRRVAEACEGRNVAVGPVSDKNYKQIGAMAIGYGQVVMASSPIDVNLAKQLNILLGNLGVNEEKIVIDPTTGGLGYGLEYTYSVMERDRMAALTQEDAKLQFPIICNLAPEVWKTRETRLTRDEDPKLGDERRRSILMEAVTAMTLLVAGADIVVMRHPDSVSLIRDMIGELCA
ncbi:MAG: Corrinoid/iron-sulfur protein small subunit [Syntrophorhabdus sp. PtaB.Bin184]|jgi:acetyl-CoA decarbonylase/synthase complex subunit delta|nr:MAG: Corrinoid/iron-sulfur protein small subunit [Syntrophorhabdus sp. PtaB.Bin184]